MPDVYQNDKEDNKSMTLLQTTLRYAPTPLIVTVGSYLYPSLHNHFSESAPVTTPSGLTAVGNGAIALLSDFLFKSRPLKFAGAATGIFLHSSLQAKLAHDRHLKEWVIKMERESKDGF